MIVTAIYVITFTIGALLAYAILAIATGDAIGMDRDA